MSSRLRVGIYTSKARLEYLAKRTSYEGERRVISTVLHCRIMATIALGLAQTCSPIGILAKIKMLTLSLNRTVIGTTGCIDIKPSEDFRGGSVQTKDNLN